MHILDRFDGCKNWRPLVENQWCWSMSLGFSGQEASHMTKNQTNHDKTDNARQCMTRLLTSRDLLIQMQHERCMSCLRAIEWEPQDGPWQSLTCKKAKKNNGSWWIQQVNLTLRLRSLDLGRGRMVELTFYVLRQVSPWQVIAEHLTHLQPSDQGCLGCVGVSENEEPRNPIVNLIILHNVPK